MKHQEYMIGDISAITGISRDTLRFYEKKGILASRKKANGYRYFTEEDLYRLVHIYIFRKLNLDLDTIGKLLDFAPMAPDYQGTLCRQVKEELEAIAFHKQVLSRLLSIKKIYEGMEECLNQFHIAPFPRSRILCTLDSPAKGLNQWFSLSRKHPGLDMAYLYDCYQYQSDFSLAAPDSGPDKEQSYETDLTYSHTLLLLYDDVAKLLDPDYDLSGCEPTPPSSCIHTVMEADSLKPPVYLITAMRQWALDQGLIPLPQVFSTSNFSRVRRDGAAYCQEIFIPVFVNKSK